MTLVKRRTAPARAGARRTRRSRLAGARSRRRRATNGKHGERFLDRLALALRAGRGLLAEDNFFEVMVAGSTVVFVDGHGLSGGSSGSLNSRVSAPLQGALGGRCGLEGQREPSIPRTSSPKASPQEIPASAAQVSNNFRVGALISASLWPPVTSRMNCPTSASPRDLTRRGARSMGFPSSASSTTSGWMPHKRLSRRAV